MKTLRIEKTLTSGRSVCLIIPLDLTVVEMEETIIILKGIGESIFTTLKYRLSKRIEGLN